MRCLLLSSLVLATSCALVLSAGEMDAIYEWSYIDYLWDSESQKEEFVKSGKYNFGSVLPMDVDRSVDGRVFMSFIGARGVPATLGIVTDQSSSSGPLIKPYPNWSYFNPDSCDAIMNVYRIAIDECNRLWVLDTGFLEGELIKCHAKLLAFDLNTDTLIQTIFIPDDVARDSEGRTMLATPIVETEGPNCQNTTVYMADTEGSGIIIWNGARVFRLESPYFKPVKGATEVTVGEDKMDMDNGVLGMDVSPRVFPGEPRFLYYRALGSKDLYGASTEVFKRSTYGETIKFFGAKNVLSSQALAQAFSAEGTLFLGMTKELGIACWNRYTDLRSDNIVLIAQDEKLEYPNGVKVIPPSLHNLDQELLVLSNRFIKFQMSLLKPSEKNFRVLSAPVSKLIRDTKCAIPQEKLDTLKHIGERLIVH